MVSLANCCFIRLNLLCLLEELVKSNVWWEARRPNLKTEERDMQNTPDA